MTVVLIKWENVDTDIWGRMSYEYEGRDWGDASTN